MLCREISKFLLFSLKLTECLEKCRTIELLDHRYLSIRVYIKSLSQRNSCKIVQMQGSPIGLKLWEINLTCINGSHAKFQVPHYAGI